MTTKDRLLDAAERLFAERGFGDVSVRDLAAAAEVNVAAVNYHFQGKENLFQEVLARRFAEQRDRTLASLQAAVAAGHGRPDLDAVIGAMVRPYLHGALATDEGARVMAVMAREMHTAEGRHYTIVFRDMVAPVFAAFSAAMLQARPDLQQEQANWLIASIVGQVHHFIMRRMKFDSLPADDEARAFMQRAFPILGADIDAYIADTTDHITRFSTAAINGLYPEVTS